MGWGGPYSYDGWGGYGAGAYCPGGGGPYAC